MATAMLPQEGFQYSVAEISKLFASNVASNVASIDVFSLLSDLDIFLSNRHSELKPLCQRQDKESLCEPETTFILQTGTKSDAQHCGVDRSQQIHFSSMEILRLLDV